MTETRQPIIGQSLTRLEDPPLVRGKGRFVADVSFPHQLHMRVVRSPLAHGRLLGISTEAALALKDRSAHNFRWRAGLDRHPGRAYLLSDLTDRIS
jgi:hypothetical protein